MMLCHVHEPLSAVHHVCDPAGIGHPHNNPHVPQCYPVLVITSPAPADCGNQSVQQRLNCRTQTSWIQMFLVCIHML